MTKKILIYIAGIVTGVLIMMLIALIMNSREDVKENYTRKFIDEEKTMFKHPGECVSTKSFRIFQVLPTGDALASEIKEYEIPTGLIVLILKNQNSSYYDDQIIKIPKGKCAKQIGVFRYITQENSDKTIPIVKIMDK